MAAETTYFYAVLALSAAGNGPQSTSISATTPAAPKKEDPPPQRVGPRQSITTDIWTATLTPAALGGESFGCTFNCSNATVLTDNDFTYDSNNYTVTSLYIISNGNLTLIVDNDFTEAANTLTPGRRHHLIPLFRQYLHRRPLHNLEHKPLLDRRNRRRSQDH